MAGKTMDRITLPAPGFDLDSTLLGGQSFSWEKDENTPDMEIYTGVAGNRAARVWLEGGQLVVQGLAAAGGDVVAEEAFWRGYFALDVDYAALQARLSADPTLAACVGCTPGIRVLRQPFYDTLLSFILSANNHLGRIAGIAARLRRGFGPRLARGVYGFPPAEVLAALAPEDLAPLRAGYRAKYLVGAAEKLAAGVVKEEELHALPTAEARKALLQLDGVGPKVADCILLFGLQRWEVAPMDVWIKKALAGPFEGGLPACCAGVEGIAQQYIFAWARQNLPKGGKAPPPH